MTLGLRISYLAWQSHHPESFWTPPHHVDIAQSPCASASVATMLACVQTVILGITGFSVQHDHDDLGPWW